MNLKVAQKKLESSGKITTNATESIESSADKQILKMLKTQKSQYWRKK